jgi:hypothetical protein
LLESRIITVWPVPEKVTEPVPPVNVEPAPDVSQLPLTVQEPLVSVIVPDVAPFMATSIRETDEALAVRTPESPTISEPPVKGTSPVASSVVDPAVS